MKRKFMKGMSILLTIALVMAGGFALTQNVNAAKKTSIKKITKTLKVGKTYKIGKKIYKSNIKKVKFVSSKKKVASVNKKGIVKAKKSGTAKITVKNKKTGKKIAIITIKVQKKIIPEKAPDIKEPTTTPEQPTTPVKPTEEHNYIVASSADGTGMVVLHTVNGAFADGTEYHTPAYFDVLLETYKTVYGLSEEQAAAMIEQAKATMTLMDNGLYSMTYSKFATGSLNGDLDYFKQMGYTCTTVTENEAKTAVEKFVPKHTYITVTSPDGNSLVVIHTLNDKFVSETEYHTPAYFDVLLETYKTAYGLSEEQAAAMIEQAKATMTLMDNGLYSLSYPKFATDTLDGDIAYFKQLGYTCTTVTESEANTAINEFASSKN